MHYHLAIGAIKVASFDLIESRVGPIKFLSGMVHCQAIRRLNVGSDDALNFLAGKIRAHDARLLVIPVCPVHFRITAVNDNGAWVILGSELDYFLPLRISALWIDADATDGGVGVASPVDFLEELVVSQTLGRPNIVNNNSEVRAVEVNRLDVAALNVAEEVAL